MQKRLLTLRDRRVARIEQRNQARLGNMAIAENSEQYGVDNAQSRDYDSDLPAKVRRTKAIADPK
jgi:hypothetical protein